MNRDVPQTVLRFESLVKLFGKVSITTSKSVYKYSLDDILKRKIHVYQKFIEETYVSW